jgi:hypothetical protein
MPKKAQTLTEIALLIGVAGLVFIGMELYIKRGLNARVKDLTDHILTANLEVDHRQEVYQVDTSGLNVSISNATTNYSSNMTATVYTGGSQRKVGTEITNLTSHSESTERRD